LPSQYLGHFLYETDLYLADEERYVGAKKLDLLSLQPAICNIYLEEKVRTVLKIRHPHLVYPIYLANRILAPNSRFLIRFARDFKLTESSRLNDLPLNNLAKIIESETDIDSIDLGVDFLNKEIFTFFLRNSNFRFQGYTASFSDSSSYRDVAITDYKQLLMKLKSVGLPLVMGYDSPLFERLNLERKDIERLNFTFCARANVTITTDSGSALIPFFLRKPIVQTNISMFGIVYGIPSDLVLPKLYLDLDSGIKLTFRECLNRGIHEVTSDNDLEIMRIGVINCDEDALTHMSDEILDVANRNWKASSMNMKVTEEFRLQFAISYPLLRYQSFPNFWVEENQWFFK
jgi:putative glycosyltransferase (TIGR04372 family)